MRTTVAGVHSVVEMLPHTHTHIHFTLLHVSFILSTIIQCGNRDLPTKLTAFLMKSHTCQQANENAKQ